MSKSKPPKGKAKPKKKPKLSLVQNLKAYDEIFKKAKSGPQIDLKKVNRIREAIKTGKYEIDYAKLADKLLDDF